MNIMNILLVIWKFIKSAFSQKYIGLTFGLIIFLLITSLFKTCTDLNREKDARESDKKTYENNIRATTDSLQTYYDKKIGGLVTEKTSYMVNQISDLRAYNEKLYKEFKDVKNIVAGVKSDVNVIIPTLTSVINDMPLSDPTDSTIFTLPFHFNYSDVGLSQLIEGNSRVKILNNKPIVPYTSTLTLNQFNVKLKYDVKTENGKYVVQATSPSELVKFTELDGVLVLDKPKKTNKFSFGPYVGFGVNTDVVGQGSRLGWSVGIGGSYNILGK